MSIAESYVVEPAEAHILVVEDNVSNFVLVARLLAYAGIRHCEWKTTGWGVSEKAASMPRLDLILLDLRLPHEDGYQVLATLRADPRLAQTRVVAVTAQAGRSELERARRAGFDGFMAKPLSIDRFPDQIARLLKGEAVWDSGP